MRNIWTVVIAMLVSATPAQADLMLAGSVGATAFCASDNNGGCGFGAVLFDQNPAIGVLALDPAIIGGLDIQGSLHTALIGAHNVLNSSSLSITNLSGAAVTATVAVSATDFQGPITRAFTTGSGTWVDAGTSTIILRWYNDPANAQGAEAPNDTPGLLLDVFNDAASGGVTSFSHDGGPFPVIDPALFSMTLAFDLTLDPGASLISRGQAEIKDAAAVPEPVTMVLFALALAGFAHHRLSTR